MSSGLGVVSEPGCCVGHRIDAADADAGFVDAGFVDAGLARLTGCFDGGGVDPGLGPGLGPGLDPGLGPGLDPDRATDYCDVRVAPGRASVSDSGPGLALAPDHALEAVTVYDIGAQAGVGTARTDSAAAAGIAERCGAGAVGPAGGPAVGPARPAGPAGYHGACGAVHEEPAVALLEWGARWTSACVALQGVERR